MIPKSSRPRPHHRERRSSSTSSSTTTTCPSSTRSTAPAEPAAAASSRLDTQAAAGVSPHPRPLTETIARGGGPSLRVGACAGEREVGVHERAEDGQHVWRRTWGVPTESRTLGFNRPLARPGSSFCWMSSARRERIEREHGPRRDLCRLAWRVGAGGGGRGGASRSGMSTRRAGASGTRPASRESRRSSSRRPGRRSGSRRTRPHACRRPGSMRRGGGSTCTTRSSAPPRSRRSTTGSSGSENCCPASGRAPPRISSSGRTSVTGSARSPRRSSTAAGSASARSSTCAPGAPTGSRRS